MNRKNMKWFTVDGCTLRNADLGGLRTRKHSAAATTAAAAAGADCFDFGESQHDSSGSIRISDLADQ